MGFFKKQEETEKKTTCCCAGKCEQSNVQNARLIVLGACCKKSTQTFENTKIAAAQMGLDTEVINIGDNVQIAKYGVMQTPALVVDGRVVSYGKLLKIEEIKKLIKETYGKGQ
ncbi:MAG: thioredoxin family protein [Christensenellaceae bacterium]